MWFGLVEYISQLIFFQKRSYKNKKGYLCYRLALNYLHHMERYLIIKTRDELLRIKIGQILYSLWDEFGFRLDDREFIITKKVD